MFSPPAVAGDQVFVASCSGSAYGLTRAAGDFVWTYDTRQDGERTEFHGTPILTPELILTATDDRRRDAVAHVYGFARGSGKLLFKHPVGVGVGADMTLEGDTLYFATLREEVVAFDITGRKERWRFESGVDNGEMFMTSAPLVSEDRVYFGGVDGRLHALDKATGKPLWSRQIGHDRVSTALIGDGPQLWAGTADSRIHLIQARDGAVASSADLPGIPFGRPSLIDDGIVVFTTQGHVVALDRGLSTVRWHTEIDTDWATHRPVRVGDRLLAGADDGNVRALDLTDGGVAWANKFEGSVTSLTWEEPLLLVGTTRGIAYATELVESAPVDTKPAGADPCAATGSAPAGLVELWDRAEVVLLGEIHGSTETPAFAGQAVCAALGAGRPVVLGLEIPASEQSRVDAYLRSAGDDAARANLLAGPFWTRDYQDGRSSAAMLALIDHARRAIAAGARLTVLCFDVTSSMSGPERDEAMARTVLKHRAAARGNPRYVALMGNLHANVEIGTPFNPQQKPMGWFLDQELDHVVALKARSAPGEYWICNEECGPRGLGGRGDPDARGITLFPERGAGWDGIFDIGVPSASPPAVSR